MGAKGTFAKFFQLFIPDASGHTFYREPLPSPASTVLARGWAEPALPHLRPAPWRVPRPPARRPSPSQMCPSDHQDSGAAINCQIQLALLSSCISLAMSCCFDPDGVPVRDMPNIFFSSLMRTENMRRH